MSDFEFLKDVLGDELYTQVADKLSAAEGIRLVNAADGSFVPKEKMSQLTESNRQYKAQIADLNSKLTAMQASATGADELRQQLADAQKSLSERDEQIRRQLLTYKVKDAVRDARAKNPDLVLKSIDLTRVSEDNGNLLGLADQLESLKKTDGYLFEDETPSAGGVDPQQAPGSQPRSANSIINDALRKAAGR